MRWLAPISITKFRSNRFLRSIAKPVTGEKTGIDSAEGRDHHPFAFDVWLAGGGTKGGQVIIGKTNDLGMKIVEDKVHIHDLHATMLHCRGLNHERLTYRSQGRDFRLTDVSGAPVRKMLA